MNIEAIDRAKDDEENLANAKASEEAAHLARQSPGRHTFEHDPFKDDSGDTSIL